MHVLEKYICKCISQNKLYIHWIQDVRGWWCVQGPGVLAGVVPEVLVASRVSRLP